MRVHSFPPMIREGAKVLVLGSMPGAASLAANQYYGNPRNHMWRVLYGLFGLEPDEAYEDRLAFAASHGIAMWDVIASCEREGSLDANIRDEVPNDLPGLLADYPGVRGLVFNGAKSHDTFMKYFKDHPGLGGSGQAEAAFDESHPHEDDADDRGPHRGLARVDAVLALNVCRLQFSQGRI